MIMTQTYWGSLCCDVAARSELRLGVRSGQARCIRSVNKSSVRPPWFWNSSHLLFHTTSFVTWTNGGCSLSLSVLERNPVFCRDAFFFRVSEVSERRCWAEKHHPGAKRSAHAHLKAPQKSHRSCLKNCVYYNII